MKYNELIDRAHELFNQPNRYGSGGNQWSNWQSGGYWYVDCICYIKTILWGGRFITENRGKSHARCVYKSNGVPDLGANDFINYCKDVSSDFNNLIPGEFVCMSGTNNSHAGLYIGNGQVMEVTPAWTGGNPGCQISQIGKNGERIKNGKQVLRWTKHGKISCIDYTQPKPEPRKSIDELADEVIAGKWGNNPDRQNKLVAAGYDYNAVQIRVNEKLAPKPAPQPQPAPQTIYEVKSGDTLSAIARKYGTTWQKIYENNRNVIGNNPNLIFPGQKLVIK